MQKLIVGFLVNFPQEELNERVSVHLVFFQLLDFAGETHHAVIQSVVIAAGVLALALAADDFGKACLVLVVLDLVSGHGHFVTAVTSYWLVRATQPMLI